MSQPEYLSYRCCMCPNSGTPEERQCPPSPFRAEPTICRFVKTYVDERGWKYKVMGGIGEDSFKARYQKPGKEGWKCMSRMKWRNTFDEAQSDLNNMAKYKKWGESI